MQNNIQEFFYKYKWYYILSAYFFNLADIFLAEVKEPPKELMTTSKASDFSLCILFNLSVIYNYVVWLIGPYILSRITGL